VIATVKVCDPATEQVYRVDADVELTKVPAVAVHAKVNVSPESASVAVTPTVICPDGEGACAGDSVYAVATGQLSPGTTVPLITAEPSPELGVLAPQAMLTGTETVCPATTLNGELVPEQETPVLVVADIDTTSPTPAGRPVTTEGWTAGSVVAIVPCTMTALVAERTRQSKDEIVTLSGRASARRIPPTSVSCPATGEQPVAAIVSRNKAPKATRTKARNDGWIVMRGIVPMPWLSCKSFVFYNRRRCASGPKDDHRLSHELQ